MKNAFVLFFICLTLTLQAQSLTWEGDTVLINVFPFPKQDTSRVQTKTERLKFHLVEIGEDTLGNVLYDSTFAKINDEGEIQSADELRRLTRLVDRVHDRRISELQDEIAFERSKKTANKKRLNYLQKKLDDPSKISPDPNADTNFSQWLLKIQDGTLQNSDFSRAEWKKITEILAEKIIIK